MDMFLPRRIRNTKLLYSHAMAPLFEAIINSIDAINESPRHAKGEIRVYIERDQSQRSFPPENAVKSFTVQDNGIGFTEVHYQSFMTSDTEQKANLGGKGIGRFLWLKAFDHASVSSTFIGTDGKRYHRIFTLRLTRVGVDDNVVVEVGSDEKIETKVHLCDYYPDYQKEVPKNSEIIAKKIIEHCLEYFVLGSIPAIFVHDIDSDIIYDLKQMFAKDVEINKSNITFDINSKGFNLHNLHVNLKYQNNHKLYFCAHNRVVISENLKIPNLIGALRNGEKQFMYAGYISGDYLDESVNGERTNFAMPNEDSAFELGWTTLVRKSTDQAASFIAPYTESVKQAKEEQIAVFVQKKAPQYRPVVKHRKDLLNDIPPNLTDDKLDIELYKINQVYESDLRKKSSEILSSFEQEPDDWAAFKDKYDKFLEEWNDAGIAKLARHIVHRKATLEFLKASLSVKNSGKYKLESAIHQLIFPLKKTSDDIRPNQMNLWILDEKLAYHYYLASDIALNKQKTVIKNVSKKRPDIIIFNGTSAFVNEAPPFSSIILVEFKRPLRDDYDEEDNPIAQLYDYVELIRASKAVDREGRLIEIKPETPFYAYVLCDLTPNLRQQAKYALLTPTPDGLGFIGYNSQVGVYLEIISFNKLLTDAERRNASLFDKLNLPLTESI